MARREIPAAELDLIPVLSLIVHIVPMLLLNVRLMDMAGVKVGGPVVPVLDAPSTSVMEEQEKNLVSVQITGQGFNVSGVGMVPCLGNCTPETYDYAGLRSALEQAHQTHPNEQRVILAPAQGIAFDILIRTMDAARVDSNNQPLFPVPLLTEPVPTPSSAP